MTNQLVVPAPVRTLALFFLIGSIVMMLASVAGFFFWLIIFNSSPDTAGSASLVKGILSELVLGIGFFLERWGLLNRRRWAYYVCRLLFFPSLLHLLVFRREDNDWITRRLKHQETQQWFFNQVN